MTKKEDKLNKRKAEFEKVSASILDHLNLVNEAPTGKLIKNLEDAKKAYERAKPNDAKSKRITKGTRHSCSFTDIPTLPTLLK